MAVDFNKLLATIEAASRVFNVAISLAEDTALALGKSEQAMLRTRLMELREQNEEGFDRLQVKLARIIKEHGSVG
jgi:hypothetical protein